MRKLALISLLLLSTWPIFGQEIITARRRSVVAGASWTNNAASVCQNQGSGTSVVCTWTGGNPTTGSSVFCQAVDFVTGTFSVTDSASNTYTAVNSQFHDTTIAEWVQLFWFPKLTGTITTVTFNTTGSGFPIVMCQAAASSGATPALEGTPCLGSGTGTAAACSTALTPTATDYIFVATNPNQGGGFSMTPTAPLATSQAYTGTAGFLTAWAITASSITPTYTQGASAAWNIMGAAFKP